MSRDPVPLLRALIACPSVTPEEAGALDLVEEALAPLGFKVTRKTFTGDGSYPVDNLFAVRSRPGPALLFAGHTDVVPPGDAGLWRADPFSGEVADDRIWGRGAVDMKSGIAAFVAALHRAEAEGALEGGTVALAITNDEEADAVNGTDKLLDWIESEGHRFDFAIVGEPSSVAQLGDTIKIGRRGSLNGKVVVTGVQGHVAYPDRAVNPVPLAARIAAALVAEAPDAGSPHFPASNLEITSIDVGNRATNVIPAEATLRFNVRFNDGWTGESLAAWLRERIAAVEAGEARVAFTVEGRVAPAFLSPLGGPVELLAEVIAETTGARPDLGTGGGTSDARFIARHCPVVECGLVGRTMHQADENVPLADLEALAELYRRFLDRFLTGPA